MLAAPQQAVYTMLTMAILTMAILLWRTLPQQTEERLARDGHTAEGLEIYHPLPASASAAW